jgi:uncharacterized protein
MTSKKIIFLVLIMTFVLGTVFADDFNVTTTKIVGVATQPDGSIEGVTANLTVEVRPGSGHVFIDTIPLTQIDTQASARLAKEVACDTLNYDCSNRDFFYIIRSDSPMIGGPSAGIVLAAATMAALQNVSLNSDVLATGTINPAGSIGPVGNILEKTRVANDVDASIFLIPSGQSIVETKGASVNVTSLAEGNWQMRVIEVNDIIDAYKYLSGYEIQRTVVSSEMIASAKFNASMKLLSDSLLKDAKADYNAVDQEIATSTLAFNYIDPIKEKFKVSKSNLDDAESYYNEGGYYSSSSFAVRSLINTKYISLLMGYYESSLNKSYVKEQLDRVSSDVNGFETMFLKDRTVSSIDSIEIYSVVIDRMLESEDMLNESKVALSNGDYDSSIYLTAYAEVRKNTAYYWLTLINQFKGNESYDFKQSNMDSLAQERIEQSNNYVVYAETVVNNTILDNANDNLVRAERAYSDEKYVFAIFEAAKARAEANLAMDISGTTNNTINGLIERYKNSAITSIKYAEEQGLLPVLALSYLEYAKTFEQSDPVMALVYLSYSKEMSSISVDIMKATVGGELLPEQPVSVTKYYESIITFNSQTEVTQQILLLATGLLAGLLTSFYVLERAKEKR